MVKTTVDIDGDLWRRFSILVLRERGERKKNEMLSELIREYVEKRGLGGRGRQLQYLLQIESERDVFLHMKEELMDDPDYREKHVAVFRGKVVGCDEDRVRLARTVYGEYGYVPIYIEKIVPDERRVEVPSPELSGYEV